MIPQMRLSVTADKPVTDIVKVFILKSVVVLVFSACLPLHDIICTEKADIYNDRVDDLRISRGCFFYNRFPVGTFMMTACIFHWGPIHYCPSPAS